jgi:hypothetical protein
MCFLLTIKNALLQQVIGELEQEQPSIRQPSVGAEGLSQRVLLCTLLTKEAHKEHHAKLGGCSRSYNDVASCIRRNGDHLKNMCQKTDMSYL